MHNFTGGFRDVGRQIGVEGFLPDAIGPQHITRLILGLRPPNERRHYTKCSRLSLAEFMPRISPGAHFTNNFSITIQM